MTRAIVLHETGGPEKLRWETVEVGEPGADELRIRHTAIGVNFHDTYVRSGSYRTLKLPGIPGVEAAGVVERVGPGVSDFAPGNRVCYIDEKYGGYAEARLLPARLALRIPDGLSDEAAAALTGDRKSTRLNSSHDQISYAGFCLKKKKNKAKTNSTLTDSVPVCCSALSQRSEVPKSANQYLAFFGCCIMLEKTKQSNE